VHLIPSDSYYHPSPCSLSSYTVPDFGVYCGRYALNFDHIQDFWKLDLFQSSKYRPGIKRLPLTLTGYNAINKWMLLELNQISLMHLDCYAISETSVKVWGWMTGLIFYDLTLILLRDFLKREISQKPNIAFQRKWLYMEKMFTLLRPLNEPCIISGQLCCVCLNSGGKL
jgi:hypothetical protein